MPESPQITAAVEKFAQHYAEAHGLGPVETIPQENVPVAVPHSEEFKKITQLYSFTSGKLLKTIYPMIFSHGERTRDVIVLTHGLSDSPYYMRAIGEWFYQEGLNVVLPLLPAHGLEEPDDAMEDKSLDEKWRREIDQAVDVALLLGDRVSLGGFSTGGALSLNKILRDKDKMIKGGLFLFSAAIDLGLKDELCRSDFILCIAQELVSLAWDRNLKGKGPNPYKYPKLPSMAGLELGQIIQDNETLLQELAEKKQKISQPVFAAHSIHDETLKFPGTKGLLELLENHVENGLAFFIAETVVHGDQVGDKDEDKKRPDHVRHEEVVLARKIDLQPYVPDKGEKKSKQPMANPKFDLMMATAIEFFNKYVLTTPG